MNTYSAFRFRISPENQLSHLVAVASGLLANQGVTTCRPDQDTADLFPDLAQLNGSGEIAGPALVATLATQVLEELRARVEADVNARPERYITLVDELPTK